MLSLLRLVFSKFRWKQHGYVYANNLDALYGYTNFKTDCYARLSKDDKDCLAYTFNDEYLVVTSNKTKTESHYLSHDDVLRGKIILEDFDRFLLMFIPNK